MLAYDMGKIALHAKIKVRIAKPVVKEGERARDLKRKEITKPIVVETTVGQMYFQRYSACEDAVL